MAYRPICTYNAAFRIVLIRSQDMQISLAAFRPKSALKSRWLTLTAAVGGMVLKGSYFLLLPPFLLRCSNFALIFMNFRVVATAIRETVLSPDLSLSIVTCFAKKSETKKKQKISTHVAIIRVYNSGAVRSGANKRTY